MSLPGQPHLNGGPGWVCEPLNSHRTTLAPQTPPRLPPLQVVSASPGGLTSAPAGRRRRFPGQSLTVAALPYFLLPDDDPWDRERWRRLGELP